MEKVLLLDGKEYEIKGLTIYENEITSVTYIDENGRLSRLADSKSNYFNDASVDDLNSKILDKDDSKNKIVQAIEEFLADEEKLLLLKGDEEAEARRDFLNNSTNHKDLMNAMLQRQEKFGRVDGIIETLNLVKLSLGYKD